ncbi:MAG TPA: hypothetical protein VKK79_07415 [Candidatus Lokiarchaeia archaeon]|nr:hypothetical protein [Candidatus Lokiarchaeia archaeon]
MSGEPQKTLTQPMPGYFKILIAITIGSFIIAIIPAFYPAAWVTAVATFCMITFFAYSLIACTIIDAKARWRRDRDQYSRGHWSAFAASRGAFVVAAITIPYFLAYATYISGQFIEPMENTILIMLFFVAYSVGVWALPTRLWRWRGRKNAAEAAEIPSAGAPTDENILAALSATPAPLARLVART